MKANRKELIRILTAISPGLATRETVEQSTCFIFDEDQVLTFNDEIAVSHPLEDLDLKGAVKATEFFALLQKLSDEEIELGVDGDCLSVKGKKFDAGIRFEADTHVEENIVRVIGEPKKWKKLPAAFLDAAQACLFSVGKNLNAPALTCIYIHQNVAISSDDNRVTIKEWDGETFGEEPLLLPAVCARALRNYEPTQYALTDGWIHFRTKDGVVFSGRVMIGSYPVEQIQKIVNKAQDGKPFELPKELSEGLERAGIFSVSPTSCDKSDLKVKMTMADNLLTVRGEGAVGWFEEHHRFRYKEEPVQFYVHPDLLKSILSHSRNTKIGAGILRFEGDGYLHALRTEPLETKKKKEKKK